MATTMSRELAALCAEVTRWRQQSGGGRGTCVPEAIWQQAVSVARVEGVYRTARATRLQFDRLKGHVARAEATSVTEELSRSPVSGAGRQPRRKSLRDTCDKPDGCSAQFVAVQMTPAARSPSITIELTSRSGERMRIESSTALDLAGVVQSFWSSRS